MNVREYRDPLKLAQDISLNRTKVLLLWEMEKRKQNDQGLRNAISNADWKKELEELISCKKKANGNRICFNKSWCKVFKMYAYDDGCGY